jgi:transcriptional regulator with PAS, ATPase and Fis domain
MFCEPGEPITLADIKKHCPEVVEGPPHQDADVSPGDDATLKDLVDYCQKEAIRSRIERFNGDVIKAAKSLEIGKTTIYRAIEKYSLRVEGQAPPPAGGEGSDAENAENGVEDLSS